MTSTLPGWEETIENITCLTSHEKVFSDKRGAQNRQNLLRQKQKSVAFIQDLIDRMYNQGDVVFDPFTGSYTTLRA